MTAKPVTRRRQAQQDIERAAAYYADEGGVALELRFLEAVAAAVLHVATHPATGSHRYADPTRFPGLQFWRVAHFPFLIFYVQRTTEVDIWRVLHDHRDLPVWLHEPTDEPSPANG